MDAKFVRGPSPRDVQSENWMATSIEIVRYPFHLLDSLQNTVQDLQKNIWKPKTHEIPLWKSKFH